MSERERGVSARGYESMMKRRTLEMGKIQAGESRRVGGRQRDEEERRRCEKEEQETLH